MKVFTIHDTKAKYYYPPQLYRNSLEAQRACANAVNEQKDSLFAKNTADFILFEIGSWDELTGQMDPTDKKHVVDLIDLVVE